MPKQRLENLMTQLHEAFGSNEQSEEQAQLMAALANHIHDVAEQEPIEPSPMETLEVLVSTLGDEHPKTHAILREMSNILKNIGV